jgi:type I restriction enzyme S subunit
VNWVKIGDATASNKYIYETAQKIKPAGISRSRMVYEGDFILSNSMSFGRPYIMGTSGCIHDGWLVLRMEGSTTVSPDFLYLLLGSDTVFKQFDRLAAGSTVRNLNIGLVGRVEIPIPPLPEQKRIVASLDTLRAETRHLETIYRQKLDELDALKKSLLDRAFKGEL